MLAREDFPSGTSKIWLDNIYIRSAAARSDGFGELLEVWGSEAHLWMTQVTLQVLFTPLWYQFPPKMLKIVGAET